MLFSSYWSPSIIKDDVSVAALNVFLVRWLLAADPNILDYWPSSLCRIWMSFWLILGQSRVRLPIISITYLQTILPSWRLWTAYDQTMVNYVFGFKPSFLLGDCEQHMTKWRSTSCSTSSHPFFLTIVNSIWPNDGQLHVQLQATLPSRRLWTAYDQMMVNFVFGFKPSFLLDAFEHHMTK